MINAKSATLGLSMLGLCVTMLGCQGSGHPIVWQDGMPVHENPHQNWWSHTFVYYPDRQVYYEPYNETYFWYEHGLWEEGMELPPDVIIYPKLARTVKLQHPKPYIQHHTVTSWHPNFYGPLAGSTDPYHGSQEAIVMSEQRAAIRVATTLDELFEFGGIQDMSSQSDPSIMETMPVEGTEMAATTESTEMSSTEMADASSNSTNEMSENQNESELEMESLLTEVDTSSDDMNN